MVSLTIAMFALVLGLFCYVLAAFGAAMAPVETRSRVMDFYASLAMRSYQRLAIVQRAMGQWELLPFDLDDEQRLAKVTLSSGMLGDDQELPFRDPADRVGRLYKRPFAMLPEVLPAAVDAELAEMGHWLRANDQRRDLGNEQGATKVQPYITVGTGLRLSAPIEAAYAAGNAVEPEWVQTVKDLTRMRFAKYGGDIGLAETAGIIMGFMVGAGGVVGIRYVQDSIIGGGGGGAGVNVPEVPMGIVGGVVDLGVALL